MSSQVISWFHVPSLLRNEICSACLFVWWLWSLSVFLQIITVNDYLAKRDSEWVGQVHRFLGMEVGLIQSDLNSAERLKAYAADVTYVTNSELGFGMLPIHLLLDPWELFFAIQSFNFYWN